MRMAALEADPSPWRALLAEARSGWWAIPAIALVLTLLSVDLADVTARAFAIVFIVNAVISLCIAGSVTAAYVLLLPRLNLPERWWVWLVHPVLVALGVVVGTELALLVLGPWVMDGGDVRMQIWKVGGVASVVMAAIGISWDSLRDRARATELRAERAQQELLRAQLENLQARLNPHFLFNSLNTVAALVEEDPAKAVTAIEQLSELLRYGLDGTRNPRVTLERELSAVGDFLELERLRFGDRLRWSIDASPEVRAVEVPPLVLQPLVENAVKHGIASRREGGEVRIEAGIAGDLATITVQDDGPGTSTAKGTQTGEANVRERLELAYGDAARFEAGPRPERGYRVRLVIPIARTEGEDR